MIHSANVCLGVLILGTTNAGRACSCPQMFKDGPDVLYKSVFGTSHSGVKLKSTQPFSLWKNKWLTGVRDFCRQWRALTSALYTYVWQGVLSTLNGRKNMMLWGVVCLEKRVTSTRVFMTDSPPHVDDWGLSQLNSTSDKGNTFPITYPPYYCALYWDDLLLGVRVLRNYCT